MRKSSASLVIVVLAVLFGAIHLRAAEQHKARGMVLSVDETHHSLIVSCEAIPGYMEAMEMSFAVRDSSSLAALKAGTTIDFEMVENGKSVYADHIQISNAAS